MAPVGGRAILKWLVVQQEARTSLVASDGAAVGMVMPSAQGRLALGGVLLRGQDHYIRAGLWAQASASCLAGQDARGIRGTL